MNSEGIRERTPNLSRAGRGGRRDVIHPGRQELSIVSVLCQKETVKTLGDSLLQTATQRLVAEFQPDQIWLFVSHAWGHPHDDSDVDLLVVVPHSDETPIRRSQRAHRCLRGLRMPKDVLVETRQEVDRVKELKTSLENIILSRGRRLYG